MYTYKNYSQYREADRATDLKKKTKTETGSECRVPFWAIVPLVGSPGLGAEAAGENARGLVVRTVGVGLLLIWTRDS